MVERPFARGKGDVTRDGSFVPHQIPEEDRWNLINFLRAEHSLEAQEK